MNTNPNPACFGFPVELSRLAPGRCPPVQSTVRRVWLRAVVGLITLLAGPACVQADSKNVLQPGDPIIASSANSPGSEGVANAIDGKPTKYLSFDTRYDEESAGFVVTPSVGNTVVTGLAMQSANDSPERDPRVVTLEGSNDDAITDFASGQWELIVRLDNIPAWSDRFEWQEFQFPNERAFKHYRWTVLHAREPNWCCFQIAEVALLADMGTADCDLARFVVEPVDTPVLAGARATFFAAANGPWPLQWFQNGQPVPGATASSYTTDPVTPENATNTYTVQMVGCVASAPVKAVTFTPSATQSIGINFVGGHADGSFTANGSPSEMQPEDIVGTHLQAYWNNAANASGQTGDGTSLPEVLLDSDGRISTITVEYATSGTWGCGVGEETPLQRLLNGLNLSSPGEPATLTFSHVPAGTHAVLFYGVSPPLQFQNVTYTVAGTQTRTYYVRQLNADEYNVAPGLYRGVSADPNHPTPANYLRFDDVSPDAGRITLTWECTTSGYDRGTGPSGVQLLLEPPSAGTPPVITQPPQPTAAAAGGTAYLTVVASGGNLTYQWRKNGRSLAEGGHIRGAATANLTIAPFSDADVAVYAVIVSNPAGSVLSQNASVRLTRSDIRDALVSYWAFDETEGSTVANAVAGGQPGLVNGTANWGQGRIGNAFSFDGETYIVASDYPKASRGIAGSAWVKVSPGLRSDAVIMRNAQGEMTVVTAATTRTVGQFELGLVWDSDNSRLKPMAAIGIGPNVARVIGTTAFPTASWRHVAFTADGAQLRLYVDGVQVASTDYLAEINPPDIPYISMGVRLNVGSGNPPVLEPDAASPNYLAGQMDDVAVWTRALTASEVSAIHNAGQLGQPLTTVRLAPPGQKLWEFQTGAEIFSSPAIGPDGTIYFGCNDHFVYAVDGVTGVKKWSFETGAWVRSSPAVGSDGTVYVGSDDPYVYALEGATGALRWRTLLGAASGLSLRDSSPAVGLDGTVYIGDGEQNLLALDGSTGAVKWTVPIGWNRSCPAIGADGTVYVGSGGGSLHAVSGATGAVKWQFQTGGDVRSSPAVGGNGLIYVGSYDQRVHAVEAATGVGRWSFLTGREVCSSPAVGTDGTVYVGSHDGNVYALDGMSGAKRWEYAMGDRVFGSPAIGADGAVYIGSHAGNVVALDSVTGLAKWVFQTGGEAISSPAIGADGTVYIGSYDRMLYALESTSVGGVAPSPWPKFRANARNNGRVAGEEPPQPPVIITQPEDVAAAVGAEVAFAVVASGTPPLTYQWHRDDTLLAAGERVAGVNTPRLTIANLVASDGGSYSVIITNSVGSVTSRQAALTLSSGGEFNLDFDNTLAGAAGEQPTTATGISFVPGVTGAAAWIPPGSALTYDSAGKIATEEGTLDFWVKPAWAGGDNATHFFVSWGRDGGTVFSKDGANNLRFFFNQWRTEVGAFIGVSDWQPEVWHHVAYTWKSAPTLSPHSQLKIYVDGRLRASSTSPTLAVAPLEDGTRLQVGGDLNDVGHSLRGALDELRLSDVERGAAEIAQTHAAGLARLTPSLTSPPVPRTNELGATAAFAVVASGDEPLSYLWRKDNLTLVDDGRVSGSTTPTLTISNCRTSDAGAYAVTVRNRYGQATSAEALLTVVASPIQYATNLVWVETLAGSGLAGYADGIGSQAQFHHPNAGAVDQAGFVYIADTSGHRVRKISPAGEVSTLAGTGVAGHADGPGATAQFNEPIGLCVDAAGTVYVVEAANHCVRKITTDGQVTTLAGNLTAGHRDGPGAQAQFNMPNDVTMDAAGNLYVTEFDNHTVRQITPDGTVSTWVGSRTAGYQDGPRAQARLTQPAGIACDAAGNLYLTEWGGQRVRKVSADGLVSTVAGTGEAGYQDGPTAEALFNQPDGIVVDALGNLWITDAGNHAVRRISAAGVVETVAGTGTAEYVDGEGHRAQFGLPAGIGRAGDDTFYVADWWNHVVRRVILPRPVEIAVQPVSRQVWLAQDVKFRVTAEGTPPLGYAWIKDGVALSESARVEGVNTAELLIRLAQPEDAGNYWVTVTNRAGARSSTSASLLVVEPEPVRADWAFAADGIMRGCPAMGWDGTLYVTWSVYGVVDAGGLHAIDPTTGQRKWTFNAAGPMGAAAAVGPDGTVFAQSSPGYLYALEGATGAVKW